MSDVGTKSREMMTVAKCFKAVHVVCLWICVLIGNFEGIWLSLGERVLTYLWELRR
jgi:hypothetical protein